MGTWFVMDIGNSAAKGGLFAGDRLEETFRLPLDEPTSPSWETALTERLRGRSLERVGLASVVPARTGPALALLGRLAGRPAELIHAGLSLPFGVAYDPPDSLGTDRLAAAAAAWQRYGRTAPTPRSILVIDAGTAVTCDVIDRTGVFRGGTIGPGPALVRRALRSGTAQLPEVPLDLPAGPIGGSTREALQAGIMYGFLDGLNGTVRRFGDVLGETPLVVATGGWGLFLRQHLGGVHHADPHLVLYGVRDLLALNPSP